MTVLLNVFAEWFRSFGYTIAQATPGDPSGPLLVERDARRIGVFGWLRREPVPESFLAESIEFLRGARLDSGVLICMGPAGDALRNQLQPHGIQLWDTQRVIQELGEAVLAETLPDVWNRTDPLLAPRASRIMAAAQPAPAPAAAAAPEPPATPEPKQEPAFPVVAAPVLATPAEQAPTQLDLPLAFGILDSPPTNPPLFTLGPEPATAPSPPPAAPAPQAVPATPRLGRQVLRSQVSKSLAVSMVKRKLRMVDRVFLRLSPFYVYDYEATLLVDGSLDADLKKGRMAVDAAQKRVVEWSTPLETGELQTDGADIDEKKVRVADADAQAVVRQELVKLVTRDVVMQEDDDEWSVVVKKKVNLGPDDVRLNPRGVYWVPIWRISGPEGAIEIDASTGNVVFEELLSQRTDSQLI